MQMQHSAHPHPGHAPKMGFGMKLMGIMMGFCLGGTVLAALATPIGVAAAALLAIAAGIAFAAVSLSYHRLMGPLMAVCCGAAVLLAATPGIGILATGLAIVFGGAVGVVSQKLMGTRH